MERSTTRGLRSLLERLRRSALSTSLDRLAVRAHRIGGPLAALLFLVAPVAPAGAQSFTVLTPDVTGRTSASLVLQAPPAVLLVHGWNVDCGSFFSLKPWLEAALGVPQARVECFNPLGSGRQGYAFWQGTEFNARLLKDYVEGPTLGFLARSAPVRDDKIDIVAHSYGGLVARYYIEKLGGSTKVRSLTTLGTPHLGTPMADLHVHQWHLGRNVNLSSLHVRGDRPDLATWDMRPGSPLLQSLNGSLAAINGLQGGTVSYIAIAGNPRSPLPVGGRALDRILGVPHDCLVPLASARGPFVSLIQVTVDAVHPSACGAYPSWMTRDPPAAACVSGSPQVFCQILLNIDPTRVQMPRPSPLDEASAGTPRAVAAADGAPSEIATMAAQTVAPGATDSHVVAVDASVQSVSFLVFWEGRADALGFAVERPDGTPVAAADSGVVATPPVEIASGFMMAGLSVDRLSPGNWIARVTGGPVGAPGQPYVLTATVDSPVTLALNVRQEPTAAPGQQFLLIATPAENGAPISGATIVATVTKPDGTRAAVTLQDDGAGADFRAGDGIYSGAMIDTALCGVYRFEVVGEGRASSGPYRRARSIFADVPGTRGQSCLLPRVELTLNATTFHPGQVLTIGVEAQNPTYGGGADLYVGALLPGGRTAVFLAADGALGGAAATAVPARFPRTEAAPPGFVRRSPSFFRFTIPATVPAGTYAAFAALVRPGALADDRIDADDVLAFDLEPFTVEAGTPPAPALAGSYGITEASTVTGCQDASDNGRFSASGTLDIRTGDAAAFTGTATLSAGPGATSSTLLQGTVTADNRLTGTFSSELFIGGVRDSRSAGTFSGQLAGGTLTLTLAGRDVEGDTCAFESQVTATRVPG